ncbi:uncharacterized protein LOC143919520 [Arctopsyche grandis]|uniref:uncharacterized protein LOC143919520 n=1 Tax=Arctopsyche grandis TaxID=121162 RepID=UPI00406D82E5
MASSSPETTQVYTKLSIEQRLKYFATFFVTELESTLLHHHAILEGTKETSAQFVEGLSDALGVVTTHFGVKGAEKIVKCLQKPSEVIEKNKSLQYHELVYGYNESKNDARRVFVEIAINLFESFEFQLAGITSQRGPQKALQRVAIDAAERLLNYYKSHGTSYSDNKILRKFHKGWNNTTKTLKPELPASKDFILNAQMVVEGKSKSKSDIIPDEIYKPGYEITFECSKCNEIIFGWKTTSLFDKIGVAVKKQSSDDYDLFEESTSRCEKYGYRRLLPDEKLKKKFYPSNEKCKTSCMRPQYPNRGDFYKTQLEVVLKFINDDDETAIRKRILQLTEKTQKYLVHIKDEVEKQNIENRNHVSMAIDTLIYHLTDIITKGNRGILDNQVDIMKVVADTNRIVHQLTDQKNKCEAVSFRVKAPVTSFVGREKKLKQLHEAITKTAVAVISQTVSVVGLGGIGKTETAKKYVDINKEYYHNIVLINAEKSETLLESFEKLADRMGIKLFLNENNMRRRDIKDIVEDVYLHFEKNGKTLMVFDNAEKYKDIKDFIFNGSSDKCIYTLITSRCHKWNIGNKGDIEVIALDIFSNDEAMVYLKIYLKDEDDTDLKSLINLLGGLPLALWQAVGYIQNQNQKGSRKKTKKIFKIKDYIDLYNNEPKELLSKGHNGEDDLYDGTIATTWRVTMQKIEQFVERGKLALSIFKIMAYLAPDNIDIEETFLRLESEEDKLFDAVELLRDYSMINFDNGIASVHRLVQQAVQIYLKEMQNEEMVLREALELLRVCDFEEHIVSVWEHSSNYSQIVKDCFNKSKYGRFYKNPIELLASHRNNTSAIEKLCKNVRHFKDYINECFAAQPIHNAIKHGNINVVIFLVEQGADVNIEDKFNGNTPLNMAARYGHVEIVKYLLESNQISDIKSSIDTAVFHGRVEIVEILMPNDNAEYLLHARFNKAVRMGNIEECKKFIKNLEETNPDRLKSMLIESFALHVAAEYSHIGLIENLLNYGMHVDKHDQYNRTPLIYAVRNNSIEVIRVLLDNGADPNSPVDVDPNALGYAAMNCAADVFELLLSKGADPFKVFEENYSLMHFVAGFGNANIVQQLIDKNVGIDNPDDYGITPLMRAALNNKPEIFQLLLNLGADPNAADHEGQTVLFYLTLGDFVDSFKLVLSQGVNPNIPDKKGRSSIHCAAIYGSVKILKLLINKGVDLDIRDEDGKTALHYSAEYNKMDAFELLRSNGANQNILDNDNRSAFHLIKNKKSNSACILQLLNSGVDKVCNFFVNLIYD